MAGMKVLVVVLVIIASVAVGLFLYSWYRIRTYVVNRLPPVPGTPSDYQLEYEEHAFFSDGLKLSAWYIPTDNSDAVVILVHGYSSGKVSMLGIAKFLNKAGYSTFLYDGRGFAKSEGNKITLGVEEWRDLEVAYDYVKNLPGDKDKKVGYLGVSMGAYIAIVTEGITQKGDFVIAATPYASLENIFRNQIKKEKLPVLLFPFLDLAARIELGRNYDQYSAEKVIGEVKAPLLIISATRDEEVDPNDAGRLFELANVPKEIYEIESGHDVFSEKPDEFTEIVLSFLEEVDKF